MKTSLKRFFALMCIIAVGMTATACKKSPKPSDESSSTEIIWVDEEDEGNASGNDSTVSDGQSNSNNSSKNNSRNSSSGKNNSGGSHASNNNSSGSQTSNNLADKYKGTTVTFATWEKLDKIDAKKVVSDFQKKYGIKVKIMEVPQSDYIKIVTGKIASGEAPDIVFDNGEFPASLALLQPITVADTIDLSDSIWDKDFLNLLTINGKTYEVSTVSGIMSEAKVFYYNKTLLKNAGCPMPADLYANGQWTWEAMESIAKKYVSYAGKGNYGMQIIGTQDLLGTIGTGFYVYDNNSHKIANGMNSNIFVPALTKMAQWMKDGIATMAASAFINRKAAMKIDGAWGLKKNGAFKEMANQNEIGFTYVPGYDANHNGKYASGIRGWGISKGAKNPGGAGLFLRYYLDTNNYDTGSIFLNSEAQSFFFKLTGTSKAEMYIDCVTGVTKMTGEDEYNTYRIFISNTDPNQVAAKASSLKNIVDAGVAKANKQISESIK